MQEVAQAAIREYIEHASRHELLAAVLNDELPRHTVIAGASLPATQIAEDLEVSGSALGCHETAGHPKTPPSPMARPAQAAATDLSDLSLNAADGARREHGCPQAMPPPKHPTPTAPASLPVSRMPAAPSTSRAAIRWPRRRRRSSLST